MIYSARAFYNQRREFNGFIHGDDLAPSIHPAQTFYLKDEDPCAAANEIYRMLNQDTRPNGPVECSLSVGDVVVVECKLGTFAYACCTIGWRDVILPGLKVDQPWRGPGTHGPEITREEAKRRYYDRLELLASMKDES